MSISNFHSYKPINAANRSSAIVIGWLFTHVFVFYAIFFTVLKLFLLLVVFILCHDCILCLNINQEEVFYEPAEEAMEVLASAVQHVSILAVSTMGQFC